MHHDASRDAPSTSFIKLHANDKLGAAKALFCRNIMEACEARSMEVTQSKIIKWKGQ
jgi:hypothetical protein